MKMQKLFEKYECMLENKISGSDKQIAWAEKIVEKAIKDAEDKIAAFEKKKEKKRAKIKARPERANKYREGIIELEGVISMWKSAVDNLKKVKSAPAIIDNREGLAVTYGFEVTERPNVIGNSWARLADGRELKTF